MNQLGTIHLLLTTHTEDARLVSLAVELRNVQRHADELSYQNPPELSFFSAQPAAMRAGGQMSAVDRSPTFGHAAPPSVGRGEAFETFTSAAAPRITVILRSQKKEGSVNFSF